MNGFSLPSFNFLILDAATAAERQQEVLILCARYESFYKGDKEENKNASPFLFEMQSGSDLAQWYIQNGWGRSWGVPVFSTSSFEEVFRHFRKFLMIKTEEGEKLYFRFYDPRVLRIFLPTCDAAQIIEFFGPVHHFICEDVDPQYALLFSHDQGKLITVKTPSELIILDKIEQL